MARRILLWAWLGSLLLPAVATAASAADAQPAMRAGIGGFAKAGHWMPVRLSSPGEVVLTAADDRGNAVQFTSTGEVESPWRYLKYGPLGSEVTAVAGGNRSKGRGAAAVPLAFESIPSTHHLVLAVGDFELPSSALRHLDRDLRRVHLGRVEDVSVLPDHWLGYDAVDTVVLATGDTSLVEQMSDRQLAALEKWVRLGGSLVLSAGERSWSLVEPDGPLAPLVPGHAARVEMMRTMSGIESYVGATQRLDPVEALGVEQPQGRVLAYDAAGAARSIPLIVRAPHGLGHTTLIAFHIERPPLDQWPGTPRLLGMLLAPQHTLADQMGTETAGRRLTHVGYEDLAGQLRGALDQFPGIRPIAFSIVAGLIVVYLLLIGPGDYFFLKRVVGRMPLSWVTFPLLVLAFCAAAAAIAAATKGQQLRVNQVDLVDVDMATGTVRGSMWAHLYSPNARRFEGELLIRWGAENLEVTDSLVCWEGHPGVGLGGLDAVQVESLYTEPYRVAMQQQSPAGIRARVAEMPVPFSSTQSIRGRWSASMDLPDVGTLQRIGASGLLEGELTNPLSVTLEDPQLWYGDWFYSLGTEWAAGQTIRVDRQSTPRNLLWRLTRRRVMDSRDVTTPYDPADLTDVPRILEMLTFHDLAGGRRYTRLSHRYHEELDLSELLRSGRAVLVARASQPATTLSGIDARSDDAYDQSWTWYRFLLPVEDN